MKSPAQIPSLYGAHLKSWRGWEHSTALEASINRWLHSGGYTLKRTDTGSGDYEFRVRFNNLPGEWPLLIGEATQNLRNSLDNLVYALAEINAQRPLTEEEAGGLHFPISGPKPLAPKALERATSYLPGNVRDFIAQIQPSNDPDHFGDHALWALHRLSNIDKHRAIPVSLIAVEGMLASQPVTSFAAVSPGTTLSDGDLICSLTPGPSADETIGLVCMFSVVFGDQVSGLAGIEVVPTIKQLREHVQKVHNQMLGLAGYNTAMPFGED